jgi:8-oxo-dGTP diphosphatase
MIRTITWFADIVKRTKGALVEGYNPRDYPPVAVTVDIVLLTIHDDALSVLLIRRGGEPFKGGYALPGGFIQPKEDLDSAAARELAEETGARDVHLEQLGTYGTPDRDPRMRVVSVAYLAMTPDPPAVEAGSDAADAEWVPVSTFLDASLTGGPARPARAARAGARSGSRRKANLLAFDHQQILRDGVERARAKLEYSSLATAFCPDEFTVAELRRVYEIVWGVELDARNFHRKITGTLGFLKPTNSMTSRSGGRPAQLYRRGSTTTLNPPILRPAPTLLS